MKSESSSDEEADKADHKAARLRKELVTSRMENAELSMEVEKLKQKVKELWRTNCQQLAEFDDMLATKVEEIAALKVEPPLLPALFLVDIE